MLIAAWQLLSVSIYLLTRSLPTPIITITTTEIKILTEFEVKANGFKKEIFYFILNTHNLQKIYVPVGWEAFIPHDPYYCGFTGKNQIFVFFCPKVTSNHPCTVLCEILYVFWNNSLQPQSEPHIQT